MGGCSSLSGANGSKDQSLTAKATVKPNANHDITFELGTENFDYITTPGLSVASPAAAATVLRTRHDRKNFAVTHNGRYGFGQSTVSL